MATIEHCIYCFEALASHLEHRKSMTLSEVEESYADYLKALAAEAAADISKSATKRHPALERLSGTSSGTASPVPSTSSSSSSSSTSLSLQQPSGVSTAATSTSSLPLADEKILETPLFVTWNIKSARHGYSLRGCIGTFEPQELDEGLSSYAITSAIHDTRFNPVTLRELPSLQVVVTLLTHFEDASDPLDWELGKHGIRISFVHHGRRYGATYLPDVAVEQGWDKEETILSLMRKAGYVGKKDRWREMGIKVVRYQGKKEKCEFEDYKAWREWVVEHKK